MFTARSIPQLKLTSIAVCAVAAMVATSALAKPVSPDAAVAAVRGALKSDPVPMGATMASAISSVEAVADAAGVTNYYIVNFAPEGFVIVAGDDQVEPIVAIAATGTFNSPGHDCLADLVKADVPGRVAMARAAGAATPEMQSAAAKWKQLQRYDQMPPGEKGLSSISDVRVAPFVQSRWNQGTVGSVAVYNYYTPPGSAGSTANYPCGCVATAMSQLMRHHQHPTAGVGTASFAISIDDVGASRNLRGGNGAGGPYAWGSMPFVPSSPTLAERQAIGSLTVDAGVAVNMNYDNTGSGTDTLRAKDAFVNTFGYSSAIKAYNSGNNIGASLNTMVQPNLHARYPVLFGITGSPGGHAIVCDGYGYNLATLYHHLNLGWGGSSDAWYNLPTIDSGGGTFTIIYKCVYNVYVTGGGEIIAGRVVDGGGNPLANALVQAFRSGSGYYTATTDANGIYALPKVPSASTYSLVVTKSGYVAGNSSVSTGVSSDNSTTCGNVLGADFTLTPVPPPSTTILTETFEGSFPADNGWSVGDSTASGPEAYWNDVHTSFGSGGAHGGTWKGYCAGVGYGGLATAPTYQNYMDAYMSKTLNLCGLSNATLRFWTIVPSIETCCDRNLVWIDNTLIWSNAAVIPIWGEVVLDLSAYVGGSHTLKFQFHSDTSVVNEGWYLDDITVSGVQGVANDCCASAIALTGGTPYTMTNHAATAVGDPVPPCQNASSKGVWFTYTPSANGPVLVTTCGSTFDSILTIYSGNCGALSYIACTDDDGPDCAGTRASLRFWGSSGTTYYIQASSYGGAMGTLQIQAQTANDYCAGAVPLNPGVAYFQDTSDATSAGDPDATCQNNVAKGVWFTFTPTNSGVVTISTCGSSYDTVVQAYTGACGSLTPVTRGCNDDGYQCSALPSYVEFNATAFTTYKILVQGFAGYYGTLAIVADVRTAFNLSVSASGSSPTLLLYPPDLAGNHNGTPPFTRSYASNTLVTLTAPSEDDGNVFWKWQLDGADYTYSVNASLNLNGNRSLVAIFVPPNDQCANAIALTNGVAYTQSTTAATSVGDPLPECMNNAGKGVWFTYTPASSGVVVVETCASGFDTVLQAHTGACGALIPVTNGCNDDSTCGTRSRLTFLGTAGTTYRILAAGYNNYSGNLVITATVVAARTLTIASAPNAGVPFTVGPEDAVGQSGGASPLTRTYANGQSVSVTAPANHGGRVFQKWQLDGVDYATANAVNVSMTSNHALTAIYAPPNDLCSGAIALSAGTPVSMSTLGATSTGDTNGICAQLQNGVWFTYTPAVSGVVTVSACGSDFDTMVQVFTGSCGSLIVVPNGCSDDGWFCSDLGSYVTFLGTAGTTYYVLAGGFYGVTGNLSVSATVSTPRSLTVASLPFSGVQIEVAQPDATGSLGGTTPLTRTYAGGTTVRITAPVTDGHGSFVQWQRDGSFYSAYRTLDLNLLSDHAMTAVYELPNDYCAGAVPLTNGVAFAMNTSTATDAGDPPVPCAFIHRGVWFKFTPAANELVLVSSCGSSFDSVMQVFAGDCGALKRVAYGCSDDGGPGCASVNASVAFSGLAGTNYYILVGGYGDQGGNLTLTATSVLQNDSCVGALPLYYGVPMTMSTLNATVGTNDVPTCQGNFAKSVWFAFNSPVTGPVPISTCGSSFDTVIQVYSGSCGTLASVACSDDNGALCSGNNASLVLNATANQTYYIMAGGWNSNSGTLRIVAGTPPVIAPVRSGDMVRLTYPTYYAWTYVLQQNTNGVNAGGSWVDQIQHLTFPPVAYPTNPATYFRLVAP